MATARHWIGTVPEFSFSPGPMVQEIEYIRGQLETAPTTGYRHWQLYVVVGSPSRLSALVRIFGGHWEKTRSQAARDYCWKEDTRVEGSQFEYGKLPFRRAEKVDWDEIYRHAQAGEIGHIPGDVKVRYWANITRISAHFCQPVAIERSCDVFWGRSGSGKSRRAWDEAGLGGYCKDPSTKWWCGYQGQEGVVIDEFRGQIGISHLLRWLDRYPVLVETKGGSQPLQASRFWITSNISPDEWYPEIDMETLNALKRRIKVTHFN